MILVDSSVWIDHFVGVASPEAVCSNAVPFRVAHRSQFCYNRCPIENTGLQMDPASTLFGTYRRQVLGLLLLRPDENFHVRAISRLTGVPSGSLHRELRLLTDAGLLLREPLGNQVRYTANRTSPIYAELAEIFRKTSGLVDLLRDALASLQSRIGTAFVFGSIAKGTASAESDVDIYAIGDARFTEVVGALASLRERLGREINPVVATRAEFDAQRASKERFLARVLAEPKLFVIGSANDLG